MLGNTARVKEALRQRLEQARAAWRERRYNPHIAPDLKRDHFETADEFAARILARPWYVGEGALRKAAYDIETSRFPLQIQSARDWAGRWLDQSASYWLILPRVAAQWLYRRSPTWPLYAWLLVRDGDVRWNRLMLVTADGEFPVETGTTTNDAGSPASAANRSERTRVTEFPQGSNGSGEYEVEVRLSDK